MKPDERLSGALQENILTLLVHDAKSAHMIRSAVTPHLFESATFREVAGHAIDFLDQFKEPIGDHLPDSLEHILLGDDKRKASNYKKLIENLHLAKEGLNSDYVISQLNKFVRQQNLKASIVKAVEAMEDGNIDAAEVELQRGLSSQAVSFDLGTSFRDPTSALSFMDTTEAPLLTGIEELDRRGIGLLKKEQFMVMAPAGMGKTWFMIHMAKWALLQRQTVVHITLEMSEKWIAQRYVQSFFAVSKRQAEIQLPVLRKNRDGSMEDVFYEQVKRLSFEDQGIRAKLQSRINREFSRRPPLIIKQFPTGQLTCNMLEAYLDGLERFHKIIPDVLVIDYPDLMAVDSANLRTDLGVLVKKLRGIAVDRNLAMLIASQSNRESTKAKIVDGSHAAEDYSKIATVDTNITYTQTPMEKRLGLARLFADKVRNDEGKFVALITQAYAIGQFALDSAYLGEDDYHSFLARGGKAEED